MVGIIIGVLGYGGGVFTAGYLLLQLLFRAALALSAILIGAGVILVPWRFQARRRVTYPPTETNHVERVLSRAKVFLPPVMRPTLLSPGVDRHIEQVLDLIVEHHVAPTYVRLAEDQKAFFESVAPQVWAVLAALFTRIEQVDTVKLASQNMVHALRIHFENFRGISKGKEGPGVGIFTPNLKQYPYLESPERELEFLRRSCEALLCTCVSNDVVECTPVRTLLREHLAARVFQPAVDYLCDPDNINLMLVQYFTGKEKQEAASKSAQRNSASFEEFIKNINKCDDVLELQKRRQDIITEIVQVKAVEKMKASWSNGIHGANFPIPIPMEKAKSLMDRDLGVYTTQLETAKTACERQLRKIGGQDFQQLDGAATKAVEDSRRRVLPKVALLDILGEESARGQLARFLEYSGHAHLLRFWKAVSELGTTPSYAVTLRLRSLYDEFLSPTAPYSVYPETGLAAQIEAYLKYEVESYSHPLIRIQQSVLDEMEANFYDDFLHSMFYFDLVTAGKLVAGKANLAKDEPEENQHYQKLRGLRRQLDEKRKALGAITNVVGGGGGSGADARVEPYETRKKALERDVSALEGNIKKLEHYISHTAKWFGTIGEWVVRIESVDTSQSEKDPGFTIVVHRATDDGFDQTGWVITRTLTEFEGLHAKLAALCNEVQFPSVPKWIKPFSSPTAVWQKCKKNMEGYLLRVLGDPKLQECEEVFNFLSPAVDSLRKSSLVHSEKNRADDAKEDSILEPLYLLAHEIFELNDWSRIIRKQFMEFVHLTYGKNLDQRLQESLAWTVSEPMLIYYLERLKALWWPEGKPAPPPVPRSDEEKRATVEEARRKVLDSVPQVLQYVLGQDNAQIGYRKMFECLQNVKANKQLFYSIFELVMLAVVPELEGSDD